MRIHMWHTCSVQLQSISPVVGICTYFRCVRVFLRLTNDQHCLCICQTLVWWKKTVVPLQYSFDNSFTSDLDFYFYLIKILQFSQLSFQFSSFMRDRQRCTCSHKGESVIMKRINKGGCYGRRGTVSYMGWDHRLICLFCKRPDEKFTQDKNEDEKTAFQI